MAVFFGGNTSEREISVLTGVFVLNVLDRTKYEVLPVYIGEDGGYYTSADMYAVDAFKGGRVEFILFFALFGLIIGELNKQLGQAGF